LTTIDGKTYENYQVTKSDPISLHIIYSGGAATIPFVKLPADIQKQYNYDPDKAAEYIKTQKEQQAALAAQNPENARKAQDQALLDAFLAQQTAEDLAKYQKVLGPLDNQKITVMVVNSQLVKDGLLVTKYYPVPPSKFDFENDHPLYIVGQFPPTTDSSTFNLDVYPAGDYTDETQPEVPALHRYVTNKLDYIKVMKISFPKTDSASATKEVQPTN
jgi:hypothetical protein